MAIYSVVACAEELGEQTEDWDLESTSKTVTLRCAWSDRYNLVDDLLGNMRAWPHGGWADPPRASSAKIAPFATTNAPAVGQSITYDDALVTVQYTHDVVDLISESIEPNADFITVDHRNFRWSEPGGPPLTPEEAPGKLRNSLSLVRTLYRVQPPLPLALLSSPGKCNHEPYTSQLLGLTFDKETLMFVPPHLSRVIRTDGSKGFTVKLKFGYKPEGWNSYWRAQSSAYQAIYNPSTGVVYKSHPLADLSAFLF